MIATLSAIPAVPEAPVTAPARARLPRAVPAWELAGPADAPVVVVLGGISATRHVARSDAYPTPGWWDHVAGEGRAIDTRTTRVLGVDWLDGGSDADGAPARVVTTHDQAHAIVRVLDALRIRRVDVVGASYGGMVALALAESFPERVDRVVAIGAAHEAHAMTTARRVVQRWIVELGLGSGRSRESLAIARALAMTTYRSPRELAARFGAGPARRTPLAVAEYLRHCGDRFAAQWDPARYLALSLSADLHRVDPARIEAPVTLVALEDDGVVPREQLAALAIALGDRAHLVDFPTAHGHDGFLVDAARLAGVVAAALDAPEVRA